MPSPAYRRFLASMTVTREMWHDGLGYDLEALDQFTPEERARIEPILRAGKDWRDAQALARLQPPAAAALLAQFHDTSLPLTTRLTAGEELERLSTPDARTSPPSPSSRIDLTPLTLEMLDAGLTDLTVFTRIATFIEHRHPHAEKTEDRVRRAILRHLSNTHEPIATNLAALACVVYGLAPSTHDWTLRPLWLRFQNPSDHAAAFDDLLATIGLTRQDLAR